MMDGELVFLKIGILGIPTLGMLLLLWDLVPQALRSERITSLSKDLRRKYRAVFLEFPILDLEWIRSGIGLLRRVFTVDRTNRNELEDLGNDAAEFWDAIARIPGPFLVNSICFLVFASTFDESSFRQIDESNAARFLFHSGASLGFGILAWIGAMVFFTATCLFFYGIARLTFIAIPELKDSKASKSSVFGLLRVLFSSAIAVAFAAARFSVILFQTTISRSQFLLSKRLALLGSRKFLLSSTAVSGNRGLKRLVNRFLPFSTTQLSASTAGLPRLETGTICA